MDPRSESPRGMGEASPKPEASSMGHVGAMGSMESNVVPSKTQSHSRCRDAASLAPFCLCFFPLFGTNLALSPCFVVPSRVPRRTPGPRAPQEHWAKQTQSQKLPPWAMWGPWGPWSPTSCHPKRSRTPAAEMRPRSHRSASAFFSSVRDKSGFIPVFRGSV